MLPRLTQSTLLDAGSCSTKLSCTGDGNTILDWFLVASWINSEGLLLLSEGNMEDAVALTTFKASVSSRSALPPKAEACLFGGGDIDLSLEDWNTS